MVLFEIYQRFKGYFLNKLRVSFKGARILSTDKKNIFDTNFKVVNKPTSNIYFEKLFENKSLDWNKIYLLSHLATVDTTLRSNTKFSITYCFSIKDYTISE